MNSPTITIRIEAELLKIMDELVQKRIFRNKSAIVREALIRFLKQYAEINPRMLYLTPEL
ncbi:ribbon-helix-helix protein, CopG family [Candidatus Bathyarchaeota archaeon]|nr:ribbon-helix-helix protein, CopG family [Candidatus Bathyarchaeota archaeon]